MGSWWVSGRRMGVQRVSSLRTRSWQVGGRRMDDPRVSDLRMDGPRVSDLRMNDLRVSDPRVSGRCGFCWLMISRCCGPGFGWR
jgi:hypothetical protein